MTSIRITLLAMTAAAFFLPATASAQGTAEQRAACTGDAFEFCGAEIPDATRVEACLRKNIRKISPACQSMFRPASARAKARVTPVASRTRTTDQHTVY
jgi:hypothetical protein